MNKKMIGLAVVLAGTLMAGLTSDAMAVPYASGISESGTVVTYVLNEDADSITVKRDVGGDLVLTGGDLLKGSHTFDKGAATTYDIEVSKSAAVGWEQTSDDMDIESMYFSPRGVAINRNPASPHFGNIYVSEGVGGLAGGVRDTLDGIFVMGADQSNLFGTTFPNDGRIGGMDTSSINSPFKITIAPDDTVYIADWADATGGVYRAPADLDETTPWPNVLANDNRDVPPNTGGLTDNHGSIPAVWVEGTGVDTKLYTMDEDWPDGIAGGDPPEYPDGRGDILRYDIGTTTNYKDQPVVQVDDDTPSPDGVILNGLMDFVRDEDGTWWVAQYRSDDSKEVPALTHWADGGTEPLWTSGKEPREVGDFNWDSDVDGDDLLTWQQNSGTVGTGTVWTGDADGDTNVDGTDLALWQDNFGINTPAGLVLDGVYGDLDIHNDLDLLITGARNGEGVYVLDISDPNNPVLSDIIPQDFRSRDVAFDIAGNVYVVSSSTETLRIWSPGGDWIATTKSDGTFELSAPPAAAAVPEPGSLLLVALGLACLAGGRFTSRQF